MSAAATTGGVLCDSKLRQVSRSDQEIKSLCHGVLYLCELFAELLQKHVLDARTHLRGLFSDQLKTLVKGGETFFCDESAGFKGLLYFRIIDHLAEFLIDFCTTLRTLAETAK